VKGLTVAWRRSISRTFNGKFRDECLSQHWFLSLAEARRIIEAWRVRFNTARGHRGLNRLTPAKFAALFSNSGTEVKDNQETATPNQTVNSNRT
jgi:putative transposase